MLTSDSGCEVFQDLVLKGSPARRSALREALLERAGSPWQHAKVEEHKLATGAGGPLDVIIFQREAGDGLAAARLVLWPRAFGYEVVNIVPHETRELDHHGYNAILQDFVGRLAEPAARQCSFDVEMSVPRVPPQREDGFPPEALTRLQRFSASAGRTAVSSPAPDREAWLQCLIQMHTYGCRPEAPQLARWLVEHGGWSAEQAQDLAAQCEFGLELLQRYEQRGAL